MTFTAAFTEDPTCQIGKPMVVVFADVHSTIDDDNAAYYHSLWNEYAQWFAPRLESLLTNTVTTEWARHVVMQLAPHE